MAGKFWLRQLTVANEYYFALSPNPTQLLFERIETRQFD